MITDGRSEALLILPVVLVLCALFAAVTGAVSLRTRGVTFIMITLAFGQMVVLPGAGALGLWRR